MQSAAVQGMASCSETRRRLVLINHRHARSTPEKISVLESLDRCIVVMPSRPKRPNCPAKLLPFPSSFRRYVYLKSWLQLLGRTGICRPIHSYPGLICGFF